VGLSDKDAELVALSYLDCAVSITCFLGLACTVVMQRRMAHTTGVNVITIADYSVKVTGFKSSATTEDVRRRTVFVRG
jgi:hypothetical protein